MKLTVFVTPKKNVLDPQGAAVGHALESLGLPGLQGVRVGKTIELEIDGSMSPELEASIEQHCDQLLSNPVIEDYRWEVTA